MDIQEWVDFALKYMSAFSGLCLVGLMVVRTDARGRWKLVKLDFGPVVNPKWAETAKMIAWTFGTCVSLFVARALGAL